MDLQTNNSLSGAENAVVKRTRYLMGGLVRVEAEGKRDRDDHAGKAVEAAFSEIKRIEVLLSKFRPGSEISRLNRMGREGAVAVSPEVFELLSQAIRYSQLTEGAFDITTQALTGLWDSAEKRGRIPAEAEIQDARSKTGSRHLILNPEKRTILFSRPGVQIDLGAMGKGYAVDRAVHVLRAHGIEKGIVDCGSSLYSLDEAPFGIEHPLKPDRLAANFFLKSGAAATSGQCERFWNIRGMAYGHLIDPRTGYPVKNDVLSLSVLGPSAMICDILSSVGLILGLAKTKAVIGNLPGIDAVIALTRGFLGFTKVTRF